MIGRVVALGVPVAIGVIHADGAAQVIVVVTGGRPHPYYRAVPQGGIGLGVELLEKIPAGVIDKISDIPAPVYLLDDFAEGVIALCAGDDVDRCRGSRRREKLDLMHFFTVDRRDVSYSQRAPNVVEPIAVHIESLELVAVVARSLVRPVEHEMTIDGDAIFGRELGYRDGSEIDRLSAPRRP